MGNGLLCSSARRDGCSQTCFFRSQPNNLCIAGVSDPASLSAPTITASNRPRIVCSLHSLRGKHAPLNKRNQYSGDRIAAGCSHLWTSKAPQCTVLDSLNVPDCVQSSLCAHFYCLFMQHGPAGGRCTPFSTTRLHHERDAMHHVVHFMSHGLFDPLT